MGDPPPVQWSIAADDLFLVASVIKISIMAETYRQADTGLLALDDPLPVIAEERTNGSGVLKYPHTGLPLTVADAVELMIIVSDNTTTNLLLRRLGADAVNGAMEELGLAQTRTAGPIRVANAEIPLTRMSRTTPREMGARRRRHRASGLRYASSPCYHAGITEKEVTYGSN